VFCKGFEHCLQFCLHHISCVKMAASQFYLQSGELEKSRVGSERESRCFGSKIP
jgi:hypothetical protein